MTPKSTLQKSRVIPIAILLHIYNYSKISEVISTMAQYTSTISPRASTPPSTGIVDSSKAVDVPPTTTEPDSDLRNIEEMQSLFGQHTEPESSNAASVFQTQQQFRQVQQTHQTEVAQSQSFGLIKDFRPAEVKLSNIEPLEGQHNYEDWSSKMTMVFDAMNVLDIVVNGIQSPPGAPVSELDGYQTLSKQVLLVLIQVITKPILKKV
ncbi:hypothetical protein BGX38DRAFT_1266191 [Terfezia claveryi]|nr:hypothetical protein BGX38DRAFT_1266191 [Terfezia claveryi]